MKQISIVIIVLLISEFAFGQIKYINTLDARYNLIELENEGLKYYKIHRNTNTVIIYNLNNTLYKSIRLELPVQHVIDQVKLIAKYQINQDELIEVAYTTYLEGIDKTKYLGIDEKNLLLHTLIISNENGEELLNIPGSGYFKIMGNGANKVLVVTRMKENNHQALTTVELYSLQK